MSKCEVRIATQNNKIQYERGDTIEGEIILIVNKQVKCNGLLLTHYAKTSGKGDTNKKVVMKTSLFTGKLEAGTYHYPFNIAIPKESSTSYNGRLLNISHRLQASVDIPWALDPKTELELLVTPARDEPKIIEKKHDILNKHNWFFKFAMFFAMWLFAMFITMSILPFVIIGVLVIGFAILGGVSYKMYRTNQKFTSLGIIHAYVTSTSSNSLSIILKLAPKTTVYIKNINVSLVLMEHVSTGSGSDRRTFSDSDIINTAVIEEKLKIVAGSSRTVEYELQLPETMTPNFHMPDNQLCWMLNYNINTKRHSYDLTSRLTVL